MLNSKALNKLIFLDIETVPQAESFFDLSPRQQYLFKERFKKEYDDLGLGPTRRVYDEVASAGQQAQLDAEFEEKDADHRAKVEALYANKAPLHPEWCRIICISAGAIVNNFDKETNAPKTEEELMFKTKSFFGDNEKQLLTDFYTYYKGVLDRYLTHEYHMVAYNGIRFDFPVIAKRMILNGIKLPPYFDYVDLKPWEVKHLVDPKESWKFSVYDANTSLDCMCELFNVPSPKDGISGKEVRNVYYNEKDLAKIEKYCRKDVLSLAMVYLRMKQMPHQLTEL